MTNVKSKGKTPKSPTVAHRGIIISGAVKVPVDDTRGMLDDSTSKVGKYTLVASEKLAEHLKSFGSQFGKALEAVDELTGRYQLDEVTVSLEITAEGQVAILGSGVTAGGTAGLELTFKRV